MKTIPQKNISGRLVKAAALSLVLTGFMLSAASAQEPESDRDLDRRVDVSREYMPDMDRAAKLTIPPVMDDTVALRPDMEYTIAPSPWITGFGVAAINPVRVDAAAFERLLPFYLKAGFGAPARSVLDIYGTTVSTGGGYGGAYLNHAGNWSKLESGYGSKERALQSNNKFGIFGRTYLGRRVALSGELGYDYDIYSRYRFPAGYYDKSPLASYSVPRLKLEVGNDFSDMSRFNFSVGAEGYIMQAREDAKESGIKAGLALGRTFGVHRLELHGGYEGVYGGGIRDGYDVSLLSVKPTYHIDGGLIGIGAGVEIAYSDNKFNDRSKTYFLPSALISLELSAAFVPYAELRSELRLNSYRSSTLENPYISGYDGALTPTRDYKLLAGFRGDVASNFSYEVRVGGATVKDIQYYFSHATLPYFTTHIAEKLKYFTAGGSLSAKAGRSFRAGLEFDYYNYSVNNDKNNFDPPFASGLPEYTGKIYLAYNYRDRLFLKLRGELTGTRKFAVLNLNDLSLITDNSLPNYLSEKVSGVFDLGLDAEYRLNRNLGVFLTGDNLLNSKLYPYYGFRGFGIGVTAGVKLLF
ncbi:MAG: hypothetical protein LUF87_11055 [Alistipes sp.]|nr:hypothetical protein [Alistipes sp.]